MVALRTSLAVAAALAVLPAGAAAAPPRCAHSGSMVVGAPVIASAHRPARPHRRHAAPRRRCR